MWFCNPVWFEHCNPHIPHVYDKDTTASGGKFVAVDWFARLPGLARDAGKSSKDHFSTYLWNKAILLFDQLSFKNFTLWRGLAHLSLAHVTPNEILHHSSTKLALKCRTVWLYRVARFGLLLCSMHFGKMNFKLSLKTKWSSTQHAVEFFACAVFNQMSSVFAQIGKSFPAYHANVFVNTHMFFLLVSSQITHCRVAFLTLVTLMGFNCALFVG